MDPLILMIKTLDMITKGFNIYMIISNDYLHVVNDHIAYRYEIMEMVGKGSFG